MEATDPTLQAKLTLVAHAKQDLANNLNKKN